MNENTHNSHFTVNSKILEFDHFSLIPNVNFNNFPKFFQSVFRITGIEKSDSKKQISQNFIYNKNKIKVNNKEFEVDLAIDNNFNNELIEKIIEYLKFSLFGYNFTIIYTNAKTNDKVKEASLLGSKQTILTPLLQNLFSIFKDFINFKFCVKISFYEIINEDIKDLLKSVNPVKIASIVDITKTISNSVIKFKINSSEEALELLNYILKNKKPLKTNPTNIISIHITKKDLLSQKKYKISMNFIELINVQTSNNSKPTDKTKDLFDIGKIFSALSDLDKKNGLDIPYKDSVLTQIMKDNLTNNSILMMICDINQPENKIPEELINLFEVSSITRKIKIEPKNTKAKNPSNIIEKIKRDCLQQLLTEKENNMEKIEFGIPLLKGLIESLNNSNVKQNLESVINEVISLEKEIRKINEKLKSNTFDTKINDEIPSGLQNEFKQIIHSLDKEIEEFIQSKDNSRFEKNYENIKSKLFAEYDLLLLKMNLLNDENNLCKKQKELYSNSLSNSSSPKKNIQPKQLEKNKSISVSSKQNSKSNKSLTKNNTKSNLEIPKSSIPMDKDVNELLERSRTIFKNIKQAQFEIVQLQKNINLLDQESKIFKESVESKSIMQKIILDNYSLIYDKLENVVLADKTMDESKRANWEIRLLDVLQEINLINENLEKMNTNKNLFDVNFKKKEDSFVKQITYKEKIISELEDSLLKLISSSPLQELQKELEFFKNKSAQFEKRVSETVKEKEDLEEQLGKQEIDIIVKESQINKLQMELRNKIFQFEDKSFQLDYEIRKINITQTNNNNNDRNLTTMNAFPNIETIGDLPPEEIPSANLKRTQSGMIVSNKPVVNKLKSTKSTRLLKNPKISLSKSKMIK